jgi:hypothetical protein
LDGKGRTDSRKREGERALVLFPTAFFRFAHLDLSPFQKKKDLEWKLTYVGSAESEKYDQVLDSVLVGPVFPGQYRFVFQVR